MLSYSVHRGMAAMFMAVILYSLNDALLKWLTGTYHPFQIMFCRSFFLFLPSLFIAYNKASWKGLKSAKKGYQALRSIIMVLSTLLYVFALEDLPLADVYAVAYVAPLFMAIFSIPILGEKVQRHSWVAIFIGFFGVLIMMRPGSSVFSLGGLEALTSGILYALAIVMSRKLSRSETDFSIAVWFIGTSFAISSLFMFTYWSPPTFGDWGLFALSGMIGGTALIALTRAFCLVPASIVGPIDYLILVFGAFLGYGIWGDIPDAYVIAGALVLVASGLYLVYQETRLKPLGLPLAIDEGEDPTKQRLQ